MAAPVSTDDFVSLIERSGLIEGADWQDFLSEHGELPEVPEILADWMVRRGLVTRFQATHMLAGRHRGLMLGQYKLLDQIGKGGTGVVFLAEHRQLRRRAAIKVLPSDRSSKESVERFYREARAVAALDHPNIIRAHDVNQEGKIHFLVMEFVEGEILKDYVENHGPLPHRQAAGYIAQIAAGLQHAHERGLIHRDIKPANLLMDSSGTIKILDMGLVLFFNEQDDTLTQDLSKGAVLGTADYLSPEQALDCHEVDIRSDIYSLGATFYTFLSGRPPFHASKITQKLIDHQIKEPLPLHELNPDIPRQLSAVVAKMMAKKPECRFQTPSEVISALAPWMPAVQPAPSTIPAPPKMNASQKTSAGGRALVRKLTPIVLLGGVLAAAGLWIFLSAGR
jgi:serine/threonine protein kinase